MKKWILMMLSLCFMSTIVYATSDNQNPHYDSHSDKTIVQPFLSTRLLSLDLRSTDSDSTPIEYMPNYPISLGVQASYRTWGLSYSYGLFNARDEDKFGETDYQDLGVTYYRHRWGFDVYYMRYKGYFISNTPELFDSKTDKDARVFQENMELFNIGADLFFSIYNRNLSLKSAFNNSGTQKKNGWAVMAMVTYNYFGMENDILFIPESQISYYGRGAAFTDAVYHSVSVMPGLGYSAVWRSFYFTPVLFAGPVYQRQHYETVSKNAENYNVSGDDINVDLFMYKYNLRLATGYDRGKVYFGVNFYLDRSDVANPKEDLQMSSTVLDAKLFGGMRF